MRNELCNVSACKPGLDFLLLVRAAGQQPCKLGVNAFPDGKEISGDVTFDNVAGIEFELRNDFADSLNLGLPADGI